MVANTEVDALQVPKEWTQERLGTLGKWLSGGTPSMRNPDFWGGRIPWVSPKDMKTTRLWGSIDYVTDKALDNGTRLAPAYALLLVVRGMILVHTFPVARAQLPVAFNQDIKALVTRDDVDSEFLLWWLHANESLLLSITTESTHGTKRMPTDALHAVEINLPPLPEQKTIAAALNDVDELIGALCRLIAKKRDLKQATMQQLLTGQIRLPGFSGKWKMRKLGDVAAVDPEQLVGDTSPSYEFQYISLEDVDRGKLRGWSTQVFRTAPSRARRRLRFGDVLVSTVRPNLMSHLWFQASSGEWVCSTGFSVVRCREGISHPSYVFAQLFHEGIARQIDALLTGSSYPAISGRDVRQLSVPFPEFNEQVAIAGVLNEMDAELAALEQRREKTLLLKQGMMQELLTGRTRLT
jgi:restriction endonuclease S subunit